MKILDALMSQAGGFGDPFASPFLQPAQVHILVWLCICIHKCVYTYTCKIYIRTPHHI